MRTGNIGAYKLTSVASAYYKGDEKNPQLQRIYGTAFKNKTQLDEYFKMLEEAKRRDHRKIGAEMGLYSIDAEFTGPGLPLWLPKGTAIVEELEKLAKETEFAGGLCAREDAAHRQGEDVSRPPGTCPTTRSRMFPPMTLAGRRRTCAKRPDVCARRSREALHGAGELTSEKIDALPRVKLRRSSRRRSCPASATTSRP